MNCYIIAFTDSDDTGRTIQWTSRKNRVGHRKELCKRQNGRWRQHMVIRHETGRSRILQQRWVTRRRIQRNGDSSCRAQGQGNTIRTCRTILGNGRWPSLHDTRILPLKTQREWGKPKRITIVTITTREAIGAGEASLNTYAALTQATTSVAPTTCHRV